MDPIIHMTSLGPDHPISEEEVLQYALVFLSWAVRRRGGVG